MLRREIFEVDNAKCKGRAIAGYAVQTDDEEVGVDGWYGRGRFGVSRFWWERERGKCCWGGGRFYL